MRPKQLLPDLEQEPVGAGGAEEEEEDAGGDREPGDVEEDRVEQQVGAEDVVQQEKSHNPVSPGPVSPALLKEGFAASRALAKAPKGRRLVRAGQVRGGRSRDRGRA